MKLKSKLSYLMSLFILLGCTTEPVLSCKTEVIDVCFSSNFDGTQQCGYPTMQTCMDVISVFGGTCYEELGEICK